VEHAALSSGEKGSGIMDPLKAVALEHPHVECRAGVQDGRPVIRGTRFPVSSIVQNHRRGLTVDEILLEFPHLSSAAVYDALSYYYDHRDQIDHEIADLVKAVNEAQESLQPTLKPVHDSD
jgi:uncharacterized protein (DUF433 family)